MELDPNRYTIAWIAPLEIEARAAACMLDREHVGRFPMQRGDDYVYQAGEICGHNVVIATLPAGQEYGTGSAAALASQVKKFFPNIWFGLLVGVAAGLPRLTGPSPRDIRLGDVLVALPDGDSAGLIAYDLGKETGSDGFQLLKGGYVAAVTEPVVRAAIGSIKRRAPKDANLILQYYDKIKNEEHDSVGRTFADPGQDADQLYGHDKSGGPTIQIRAPRPDERRTRIWYGPIGSGDKLMKNASKRNELRDRYNIIGLEMEAAGTMNRIPVGVIRGVCDYGDEHKNKEWQPYASAMAAAYAKAVLAQIGPRGLTHVHHIPFRRNHDFTGRRAPLDQLERMLFREKRERVAVVGLGGMGKTQIALELAYRVLNMEVEAMTERHSIFWVQAQSIATFHKTAGEVVRRLKIQYGDEDPKKALRTYLESDAAGYWLLIVDNLDETAVLDGVPGQSAGLSNFFPRNPKGRLLITTRQASIAIDATNTNVVELVSMTFDEASSLMETLLLDKTRVQDKENLTALLQKLAYLPLTLAQAAAYINKNRTTIARYLALCQSADQNMVKLLSQQLRDETHHSKAQSAVVTTWTVSFVAVRKTDINAIRILSFIRWSEPKAIPMSMLPMIGSQVDLEQSIGLLCGYGFLSWRKDGKMLDMHELVHLVLRLWLDRETDNYLTTKDMATQHFSKIFPSSHWENRLEWRQLLPHVLLLVKDIRLLQEETTQSLGYRVGLCLEVDGRIREAIEIFELVATTQEETLAEAHPSRLTLQQALASTYLSDCQPQNAIQVLEHVVAVWKQTVAETHPARLASQCVLGSAYLADSQVEKAVKLLEPVVAEINKEIREKPPPDRLALQHQLACAYLDNGQVADAMKLLEHVVAIKKETLDEAHPSRIASQYQLARAYLANCQVKEAMELLKHIVAMNKDIRMESHPDRLAAQRWLARAHLVDGQFGEAVKLLEHVVAINREKQTETRLHRLAAQQDLALAYQMLAGAQRIVQHLAKFNAHVRINMGTMVLLTAFRYFNTDSSFRPVSISPRVTLMLPVNISPKSVIVLLFSFLYHVYFFYQTYIKVTTRARDSAEDESGSAAVQVTTIENGPATSQAPRLSAIAGIREAHSPSDHDKWRAAKEVRPKNQIMSSSMVHNSLVLMASIPFLIYLSPIMLKFIYAPTFLAFIGDILRFCMDVIAWVLKVTFWKIISGSLVILCIALLVWATRGKIEMILDVLKVLGSFVMLVSYGTQYAFAH